VVLVRTDDSEELSASIIRVTRTGEIGTLSVTRKTDDGGVKLLRNVGSYSHCITSQKTAFFINPISTEIYHRIGLANR
jgi:hypothetical protein